MARTSGDPLLDKLRKSPRFKEANEKSDKRERKRLCKILYFDKFHQPKRCGGQITSHTIHKPFDMRTPIGGRHRPPKIDSYESCQKCGVRYDSRV